MGLLSSVSKYYKMSFDKNVLIYVQRPDAGLLATKMGWEKQTGRYLKAGSKGIGVVDMNNPKATLAYYFDLADELVEEFEEELRCKSPDRFQAAEKWFEEELEQGVSFDKKILSELSERLFALRTMIPEHGRIAYGFLPPESREKTDELVQFLLLEIPEIRKCFERYVDAKCSMAGLYAADEEWLLQQKKKFEKEAEKILANRVLSGVKAICRLEKEKRGEAYLKSHKEYLASRMIMEALDMLAQAAWKQEEDFLDGQGMSGELSKEAKKELFLRNQDKGYEH